MHAHPEVHVLPGMVLSDRRWPAMPVLKVEGGLQAVRLLGSGFNRVVFSYQPTGLAQAVMVSLTAIAAAVCVLGTAGLITAKRSTQTG